MVTKRGFDKERVDGTLVEDNGIAEIVETALALHIATIHGHNFSTMGNTLEFANWLVASLGELE